MKLLRRAAHLSARFVSSLVPRQVSASDRAWVANILEPAEFELWLRLSRADAVESVGVARRVERALCALRLGDRHTDRLLDTDSTISMNDVCAAALVHDVGKLDSGLHSCGRVVATVAGALAGHGIAEAWSSSRGCTRRAGLYLRHHELGADRIGLIGGRRCAADWARAHHDPSRWPTIDFSWEVCVALAQADGENVPTR